MDLRRILYISNMDYAEVIVQPHGTLEFPSSTKYFEGKLGQYCEACSLIEHLKLK